MKTLCFLLAFSIVHSQTSAQWTVPRVVDPACRATPSSNPLISIGPDRELVIVVREGLKLACYNSTDLGTTFSRVVIDTTWSYPPWYSFQAGLPAGTGFNNVGSFLCLASYVWRDDIAEFVSYEIKRFQRDSTRFVSAWNSGTVGGAFFPGPPVLISPAMFIRDSTAFLTVGKWTQSHRAQILCTTLRGDNMLVSGEHVAFDFPFRNQYGADLVATHNAVHCVATAESTSQRPRLYYSRKSHQDSTFLPMIALDTVHATSPRIIDIGSGELIVLYSTGTAAYYSDSTVTARVLHEGSMTFSLPFTLTSKSIRHNTSTYRTTTVMRTHRASRHVAYSTTDSIGAVAYYEFGNLQLPPVDSAIFRGFQFGDLALDSLGGKYLLMTDPVGGLYLSKKDVVTSGQENKLVADGFHLHRNYPNPFNPTTHIAYQIPALAGGPAGGFVSLKVYDLLGREVATLVNEVKPAGEYSVPWDARDAASGVYFYRLTAGQFSAMQKMIVLK